MKTHATHQVHLIRRIYRNYFSKYRMFTPLKRAMIRYYQSYLRKFPDINASFISISEFLKTHDIKKTILIQSVEMPIFDFCFFKPQTFSPIKKIRPYMSPECSAYELRGMSVISRTDFLSYRNLLIHDDNYLPLHHVSTLDQFNIGGLKTDGKTYRFPLSIPSRVIEKGINLTSGGAGNYAHFLTEIIPRLIAVDRANVFDDYPIIVDGWIGKALTEILIFFNKKCRQIIALEAFENVLVENLIHISAPVFAPQDFRINTDLVENKSDIASLDMSYLFSSAALQLVRDFALTSSKESSTHPTCRKRIYLKRSPIHIEGIQYNSTRGIINDREVISILKEYDFDIVDITSLNFLEQIKLFRSADIIVSPLGAVLTNCIFCDPSSIVIGLGAYYEGADYSYHSEMMASLGLNYSVVLGAQYRERNTNPLHYSYFICIDSLRRSLDELAANENNHLKENNHT